MPTREPADHDPLDAILRPPLDETPEEKACRMAQEEEARPVLEEMDLWRMWMSENRMWNWMEEEVGEPACCHRVGWDRGGVAV